MIDGLIESTSGNIPEKISFETLDAKAIADNKELSDWVQKQHGINNIAYTRIGDELFVYMGVGEKPTGGYTVEVTDVLHTRPDEAFVNAVLHSPAPDMMVIQVFTTPYTVIRFNQGTIKHVGGEIRNVAAIKTLNPREG
ncbi:MAG: protease complex subunit PrcB family protein [Ruminiclostridium sp.]|nr:protease complex subunit PrcB family protein [Ruminiclostridium sp.]